MAITNTLNVYEDPYNIQDPRIGGTEGGKAFDMSLSGNTLTFTHPTTNKKINFTLTTWYWFIRGSQTSTSKSWYNVSNWSYSIDFSHFRIRTWAESYGTQVHNWATVSKISDSRISGTVRVTGKGYIGYPGGSTPFTINLSLSFDGAGGSAKSDAVYVSTSSNIIGTGAQTSSSSNAGDTGSQSGIQYCNWDLSATWYPYTRTQV